MKRNKRGAMPEITRETYKRMKRYDRQQFTNFCKNLYGYGYEDGRDSVPGIDLEAVMTAIKGTKGIGAKKLEDIRTSIEAVFEKAKEVTKEE